jgi:hypothetical protein
MKEFY